MKKKKDDDVLIVQSGSVDITNLKTDGCITQNVEYFKQKTLISAKNLFTAVSNAEINHPHLKKIIILKQIPRYDFLSSNPPGLKHHLSKLYNDTLDQLFSEHPFKNKMIIGNHNLECSGGVFQARYRNIQSGKFDAVHLFGPSGVKSYTASVLQVLSSANLVKVNPTKYYDQYNHKTSHQAGNQNKQRNRNSEHREQTIRRNSRDQNIGTNANSDGAYQYEVPTNNRYATLGDYFPGNF